MNGLRRIVCSIMALCGESPQTENGHVRIATELWEALYKIRVPGEQMQVLLFIIRKTYGWGKKTDGIPLSQFVEATGISKTHIIRAINGLADKNMIVVTKKGNRNWNEYGFIKHYSKWKPLPKKVTLPKKVIAVTKKGNLPLPKKGHSIDTKSIDTKSIYTPVIDYLNKVAGKKYSPKSKKTIGHINARLKEGRTLEDFKYVIEVKVEEWAGTEGEKWIRPETLFGDKFESYLNQPKRHKGNLDPHAGVILKDVGRGNM